MQARFSLAGASYKRGCSPLPHNSRTMAPRNLNAEGYELVSTVFLSCHTRNEYWERVDGDMLHHVVVKISTARAFETQELSFTEKSGTIYGFYSSSSYASDGTLIYRGDYYDKQQKRGVGCHVVYNRCKDGEIFIRNSVHNIGNCITYMFYSEKPEIDHFCGYHDDSCECGPSRPYVPPKRVREEIDLLFGKPICTKKS